ncbi:MAG TPA: LysR family transcriptional regulator [Candidatus Binatia bacterium]|jgi:DNA-binding transcriptional LysR family regulator
MTLWQLKVFSTVAKTGSFTKAAKALQITQPSTTTLVQSLSRELGVKLFEKLGIKIHVTSAGEEALRYAHQILGKEDEFRRSMEEFNVLKKGTLRIGGSVVAGASFLPAAIQQFKEEHPDFEVALKIERSDDLEKMLLEGELDVAIMGFAPRSRLVAGKALREEEVVVICPPNHPFTTKRAVPLKLLAAERLISAEKGILLRDLVEQKFIERGLSFVPSLQVNLDIGSRDVVRNAVASGLGIGFLSKCLVVNDVAAGRIKILNVPELKLKRIMYLAVHKNRQHSALMKSFTDHLSKYGERQ